MLYWLLTANFVMGVVFFLRLSTLPPQIPLFYSRAWGEYQLADWWFVFLLPLLLNFFYFFNLFVKKRFFAGNEVVGRFFFYLNIFLILSFTFIFVKIIFLVT